MTYTAARIVSWALNANLVTSAVVAMAAAEMVPAERNMDGTIAGGVPNVLPHLQLAELLEPRLAALDALDDASRAQGRLLAAQSRTIASLQSELEGLNELKELKNLGGTMGQQQGRRQMQSQACGGSVDQSMMVQAMALIGDARDRLTDAESKIAEMREAASNGVNDLAIQVTALSEHVGTIGADLDTTSDNFMALEGLLYDALPDTIGHNAMIMNGHVYTNQAEGRTVTTSSCYSDARCGDNLVDGLFYFNVGEPGAMDWLVTAPVPAVQECDTPAYGWHDYVIYASKGHDVGAPVIGTVDECAAACCAGFSGVECVGFSRSKSAGDSAASKCWFKGQTPEADRTNGDVAYSGLRIISTRNHGSSAVCFDGFELFDGETMLDWGVIGTTITDTGEWGGYPGINAIGNDGYYCSESGSFSGGELTGSPETLTVLLDTSVRFTRFQLMQRDGGGYNPRDFSVEAQVDGAWIELYNAVDFNFPENGAVSTFYITFYHTFYRSYPEPVAVDLETAVIDLGEPMKIQAFRVFNQNEYRSHDPTYVATATDCALHFESSDQHARFVDPNNVLGLDIFTLAVTFRRDGRGTDANTGSGGFAGEPLLTKGRGEADSSSVDMNWGLFICDPQSTPRLCADFEAFSDGQNYPVKATSGDIELEEWHTGVATWDGSTWKLYLDGAHVGQATPPSGAAPRHDSIQWAGIGTAMTSNAHPQGHFNGAVSEAAVWNVVLSASDIASGAFAGGVAQPVISFDTCGTTTNGLHAIDVELMNGLVASVMNVQSAGELDDSGAQTDGAQPEVSREVAHINLYGCTAVDSGCTNLVLVTGGALIEATDGDHAQDLASNPGTSFHVNGGGAAYQFYKVEVIDTHAVTPYFGLMEVQLFTLKQVSTGAAFVDAATLAAESLLDMDRVGAACSKIPGATSGEYHIDYGAWAGTVFCDLVTQGGGWTMLMKAQKGNTFGFDADHWTTATTLNEGSTSRDDADAKFEPFNSMLVHAFLAVWPDDGDWAWRIGEGTHMTLGGGGMTALEFFQEHRSLARGDDLETSSNGFHEAGNCDETAWPDKDHGLVCGECKVLVDNMASVYGGKCDTYCAGRGKICMGAWEEDGDTCTVLRDGDCSVSFGSTSDAICECSADEGRDEVNGWSSEIWSWQGGYRKYMVGGNAGDCDADAAKTRWGYSWNDEDSCGSNDAAGGIGMKQLGYSAGDYFGCCGGGRGRNGRMRVEVYGR